MRHYLWHTLTKWWIFMCSEKIFLQWRNLWVWGRSSRAFGIRQCRMNCEDDLHKEIFLPLPPPKDSCEILTCTALQKCYTHFFENLREGEAYWSLYSTARLKELMWIWRFQMCSFCSKVSNPHCQGPPTVEMAQEKWLSASHNIPKKIVLTIHSGLPYFQTWRLGLKNKWNTYSAMIPNNTPL